MHRFRVRRITHALLVLAVALAASAAAYGTFYGGPPPPESIVVPPALEQPTQIHDGAPGPRQTASALFEELASRERTEAAASTLLLSPLWPAVPRLAQEILGTAPPVSALSQPILGRASGASPTGSWSVGETSDSGWSYGYAPTSFRPRGHERDPGPWYAGPWPLGGACPGLLGEGTHSACSGPGGGDSPLLPVADTSPDGGDPTTPTPEPSAAVLFALNGLLLARALRRR